MSNIAFPYRSSASKPTTTKVDTDDVQFTVHYLNTDDTVQTESCSFIGVPTAKYSTSDSSVIETHSRGSSKFREWLEYSAKYDSYIINEKLIIPKHRLLKITQTVTSRCEEIEIQHPKVMD